MAIMMAINQESARRAKSPRKKDEVKEGALAAESLEAAFPEIDLPIQPPYRPMEAKSADEIPEEAGYLFEPKWDGFRCLAFRHNEEVLLQSKAGQPLGRYFPEMVAALAQLPAKRFVLDGEIVIFANGALSFDDLLLRVHPAASRIKKLSVSTPATLMCFDLLVDENGNSLAGLPLSQRREKLEKFLASNLSSKRSAGASADASPDTSSGMIRLSPASPELKQAKRWMGELATMGLDGVIAKRLDEPYLSGERTGMVKIKRIRTADCVVGGFRYAEKGGGIGSLLLGLNNDEGKLDHVGFTSSFSKDQRQELKKIVEPLIGPPGFTGRAPGGPSRWSTKRSTEWQPLKSTLVCEVSYDHFSGGRFRHGTKFLRWRPDKRPDQCTFQQLERPKASAMLPKLI